MCGRYRRTSDKQRIAEVFRVEAGLEVFRVKREMIFDLKASSLSSTQTTGENDRSK